MSADPRVPLRVPKPGPLRLSKRGWLLLAAIVLPWALVLFVAWELLT